MVRSHPGALFYMQRKIQQLILEAEKRMLLSGDQFHDAQHARRVAENVKQLVQDTSLSSTQKQAVILAAWWHDTGRTIIQKPSVIWMRLVDDIISSFLLWKESLKLTEFSSTVSIAIRLIMCKNIGTGKFFIRILLPKKDRILLSILKDADTLDTINVERVEQLHHMTENFQISYWKYRFIVWWFLHTKEFQFRTEKAKQSFETSLEEFLTWMKEIKTFEWHKEKFGLKWIEKNIAAGEDLLDKSHKA